MRSTSLILRKLMKPKLFEKKHAVYRNYNRSYVDLLKDDYRKNQLVSFSQDDIQEFMSYFPVIVKDLTSNQHLEDIEDITKRFEICLNTTVPNGKRVRGLTTVITYKLLEKPGNLTPENIKLANILGWCTEVIEGAVIVYDDVMDNSVTRRNGPCWHRQEGVGLIAIADAIALNTSAFIILKKYFSTHPFYVQMFEFFHWVMFNTAFGQVMDSNRYTPQDISMDKFKTIAKYKTGFYTFYYPVVLGMYLSKRYDQEILDKQIAPILFDMGEFFQIKNDMNDCFAKEDKTGKAGTDIEESKCTWLAVKALQKCNASQRRLFEKNYGNSDKEAVDAIRNLYVELKLHEDYQQFKDTFFKTLRDKVKDIKSPYLEVVTVLMNKLENQIYKSLG